MDDKKKSNQDSTTSFSFESQVGECVRFWLASGPPFDQRDYMISPSESATSTPSRKISASSNRKVPTSSVKIESKYGLDSQKALRKLSELIKDGCAEHLVDRLETLIQFFLQGTPLGFLVDDLPLVVEIVEFFSRSRSAVPKFTDFVKTIMCYASEPPRVGRVSDLLHCKEALSDYFTLFGELLATFEEECFQLHLLEALDCLIIRRKLVDLHCVKLTFCHEAMEASQLPGVIACLMETIPHALYLHYLELALQIIWVSVKSGCLLAKSNVIEYVLWRMEPLSAEEPGISPKELESRSLKEPESHDYYRILDKSAFLIWGLFAIASKYNIEIPIPKTKALWSLKCVFHREARKKTQKSIDTRNDLAAIITKLCALFGDRLALKETDIVGDIASLAVATEIKSDKTWLRAIDLTVSKEDFVLKKLMLLCCCLFSRNEDLIETLRRHKVIEGILNLITRKNTRSWIPSQFHNLLLISLRILTEMVPKLPETYLQNNGNGRLLCTIRTLMEEPREQECLLEALKTFCTVVTCDKECIVKDVKAQNGVEIMLDLCFRLLNVTFMKLEHQKKLSRVFVTLEALFRNDKKIQTKFEDSSVSLSIKLLRRILEESENDSKWDSNLFVSFGGFLWEAVAWCSTALKSFIEKSGIFLLLDFLETRSFPVQMFFLGILVDMTDEGETIAHLLTWRGKSGSGVLSMMIDIWRKEEILMKVPRTREGIIIDVETPLMSEEQWFLSFQVSGGHVFSPSLVEMVCSARPKVHALYQFLQRYYFSMSQVGESNYCLQMKMTKPTYQVYIPLIEHFLALKLGEIWYEVIQDAFMSGVLPTLFDGNLMYAIVRDQQQWASRIKTMQEEIFLICQKGDTGEEKGLYNFIRSCQLSSAMEDLRQLDYIARTSFQKFQKQRKNKQIEEMCKSLAACSFLDENIHRTFLINTNATFLGKGNIWVKSEKITNPSEDLPLISPDSCSEKHFSS